MESTCILLDSNLSVALRLGLGGEIDTVVLFLLNARVSKKARLDKCFYSQA